jgi:hypothetical protein
MTGVSCEMRGVRLDGTFAGADMTDLRLKKK